MDACELGDCGASYDTHRPNKLPPENVSFMMVVGFCTPCLWRAETRDEQSRRVYPTRALEFLRKFSSGSFLLLTITLALMKILQNI